MVPAFAEPGVERARVVVIQSYHPGYVWSDRILDGLGSAIPRDRAELLVEYLDTQRNTGAEYDAAIDALLRAKYAGQPAPAAVIACDNPAFDFVLARRAELFHDAPLVFCGINDFDDGMLAGVRGVTGVVEDADFRGTIELALRLGIGVRRLIAIGPGAGPTRDANLKLLMRLKPEYGDALDLATFASLSPDEVPAAIEKIPADAAILFYYHLPDEHRRARPPDDSLRLLRAHTRVPIFACWDFAVERGALGGRVVSGFEQGRTAGWLLVRILDGESPDDIAIVRNSPNVDMFNASELQRLGVERSGLPRGSVVVGAPPSFYREHWEWFWILGGVLVVQGVLIVFLVFYRVRRRRAEAALRESEERLDLALAGGNLALWDCDFVSGHVTRSDRYHEMLGYAPGEIPPTIEGWRVLIHPADADIATRAFEAHVRGERPFVELEHRLRSKTGEYRWIFERGRIVRRSSAGEPQRASGISVDVSARRRGEELLKEALGDQRRMSEFLAAIMDALPARLCILDRDGAVKALNRAWKQAHAGADSPLARLREGDNLLLLCRAAALSDENLERIVVGIRGVLELGSTAFSHDFTCGEGPDARWCRLLATPLPEDAGSGAVVLVVDISEVVRAMQALAESEEKYRNVAERANDGIAIVQDGGVCYANTRLAQMLDCTVDRLLGRPFDSLVVPEARERVAAQVVRHLAGESAHPPYESALQDSLGRRVEVEVNACAIQYRGRRAVLKTIRDITARKREQDRRQRLDAQLAQAARLESLGVLAGGIAHDFNNLLVGILGHAELAADDAPEGSPLRASLRAIENAAKRAAELTRQMLAYAGRGRFVVEAVDVREVVREIIELLRVTIPAQIDVRCALSDRLPRIAADAAQIRQVVLNLLTNAAESIGNQSGVIRIAVRGEHCSRSLLDALDVDDELPEGEYVVLEIADTGGGMTEDTRRRIFEPFFTTKFTGRGLGLAATLGIIRGHRGGIRVQSEPGRGATFLVYFPVASEVPDDIAVPSKRPTGDTEPAGNGALVLLVDDDEPARNACWQLLERHGYRVLTASNGAQAVELFRAHGQHVRCVILDRLMPGMDGAATCNALRAIREDVPVILISGAITADANSLPGGVHVEAVLRKPYRSEELAAVVRRVLR